MGVLGRDIGPFNISFDSSGHQFPGRSSSYFLIRLETAETSLLLPRKMLNELLDRSTPKLQYIHVHTHSRFPSE